MARPVKKKVAKKKVAKKKVTRKKVAKKTGVKKRGRAIRRGPSVNFDSDGNTIPPDAAAKRNQVDDSEDLDKGDAWLDWYDDYLVALREEYSKSGAALRVGKDRRTPERHRKDNAHFAKACESVWESAVDELEASAFKRSVHGNREPIYFKADHVGNKVTFETSLTIFMLKQNRKGKYAQDNSPAEQDARKLAFEFRKEMTAMDATIPGSPDESEDKTTNSQAEKE